MAGSIRENRIANEMEGHAFASNVPSRSSERLIAVARTPSTTKQDYYNSDGTLHDDNDKPEDNTTSNHRYRVLFTDEQLHRMAPQCNMLHVDTLCGLFLQTSTSGLDLLARNTHLSLLRLNHRIPSCSATGRENLNSIRSRYGLQVPWLPSVLSLVPLAQSKFRSLGKDMIGIPPIDTKYDGVTLKRQDYQCSLLEDLESRILERFESSTVGGKAISTENLQYSMLFEQADSKSRNSAHPLLAQKKRKFASFALTFNEVSMFGFAQWAFRSQSNDGKRNVSNAEFAGCPKTTEIGYSNIPVSSSMFHRCQICSFWGHFEVECNSLRDAISQSMVAGELLPSEDRKTFYDPMTKICMSKSRFSLTEHCETCKSTVSAPFLHCSECTSVFHHNCVRIHSEERNQLDWLCPFCEEDSKSNEVDLTVDLEGCDGFVIEQKVFSKNPSTLDLLSASTGNEFNECPWSRVLALVDNDLIMQDCSYHTPTPVFEENQDLAVGQFCWAKREHASAGSIGRDEWWPSKVVAIVPQTKCKRVSGLNANVTQYLVKMSGIAGANRVRASAAIPFMNHFQSIVSRWLSQGKNLEDGVQQKFSQGVLNMIAAWGFKSINEALLLCGELSRSYHGSDRHQWPKRLRSESEFSFESFAQDGFTIRARTSEKSCKDHREDLLEASDAPYDEVIANLRRNPKFVGCLVAWQSANYDLEGMAVGTVLATNMETKLALVSAIPQWDIKLKSLLSRPRCGVVACDVVAPEWMHMDDLHVISNGSQDWIQREVWDAKVAQLIQASRMSSHAETCT